MFETFTNMHYLSSSSSDSDSAMATENQDLQYGYERGFTCHDELSMVSSSASSEHPDYHAILFGPNSDSSDTEEPIEIADYPAFAAILNQNIEDPLTSTVNEQSLSIHLQVSQLEVLEAMPSIHREVSQLEVLEERPSRVVDRFDGLIEPNMKFDLVPVDTPDQPNQIGE